MNGRHPLKLKEDGQAFLSTPFGALLAEYARGSLRGPGTLHFDVRPSSVGWMQGLQTTRRMLPRVHAKRGVGIRMEEPTCLDSVLLVGVLPLPGR